MSRRINVSVGDDYLEELKVLSTSSGIPIASLCSMSIMTFIDNRKAIASMNNVKEMMDKIEKLGSKQENVG
jgi:hypothetical protein